MGAGEGQAPACVDVGVGGGVGMGEARGDNAVPAGPSEVAKTACGPRIGETNSSAHPGAGEEGTEA